MPTLKAPSPGAGPAAGTRVVARFRDGRVAKGATQDFSPGRASFHLFEAAGDGTAVQIDVSELKAVFFVRSYDGDSAHRDDYDFDRVRGHGRKAVVVFEDGETIEGYTMGYHPEKPGFFLVPADDGSNNTRIYVVRDAIREVRTPEGC